MILSPIVNTDIKMSKKMFDALCLHEMRCMVTGVHQITEESVKTFLTERCGEKLASTFQPHFLFNIPDA
jgi:hypothetical protein